jgi:hypothetical protein
MYNSKCTDSVCFRPAVVDEHHERKASIFDDEQKRKESVARLTANFEGE